MTNELTEMAGVAEAETQAAYAWALDYGDDLPTQRLTPRRITALALASESGRDRGGWWCGAYRGPSTGARLRGHAAPVVVTPAAVLDGTYQFDYNYANNTIMGSPNPPPERRTHRPRHAGPPFDPSAPQPVVLLRQRRWMTPITRIAFTPFTTHQWRFTEGRWQMLPERSRETRQGCKVEQDKTVDGDETVLRASSLEPQAGGSLRGLSVVTAISSECGQEGAVYHSSFIATRVGDVPPGVPVADPSTVSVPPEPVAPVAGPVLDGTYRLDEDDRQVNTAFRWFAFR